jgi:hypothetical protein
MAPSGLSSTPVSPPTSKLIEERWAEIEAVAFALYDGFFGSGDEKLGRLGGVEVERIIDSVGKKGTDA